MDVGTKERMLRLCGGACCDEVDLFTFDDPEDVPPSAHVALFRVGPRYKCMDAASLATWLSRRTELPERQRVPKADRLRFLRKWDLLSRTPAQRMTLFTPRTLPALTPVRPRSPPRARSPPRPRPPARARSPPRARSPRRLGPPRRVVVRR